MRCVIASLLLLAAPLQGHAWGEKGHAMISRLAIETAAPRLPEFMNASRGELIYNANEPDRWREEAHSPMNLAQQADHFFDSELWGPIPTIEPDRYQFMEKVAAKKVELVKVGYLPYASSKTMAASSTHSGIGAARRRPPIARRLGRMRLCTPEF